MIASNVPSSPSTAALRSALKPAMPVTYDANGFPSGPGRNERIAATSDAIDSVSSPRLVTDSNIIVGGSSAEIAGGTFDGAASCPLSPHTGPLGASTALRSGSSSAAAHICSPIAAIAGVCAWIDCPSVETYAITAVASLPSGKRESSRRSTRVESAPRAKNVWLSSEAIVCSFGCSGASTSASTTHTAMTIQRDRRPTASAAMRPPIT